MRALARLLAVTALVASVLLVPTSGTTPASTAAAADLSFFDPGNIISDAVFFDGMATDAGSVDAFLDIKGAKCAAGEMPCLKDYTQTTYDQAGDAYCAPYRGAPNETAGAILVKVGIACGINPRALVVLLQKEQGLVTGTRPQTRAYTKATGFACPDTAPCNPQFSGFVSQVYFGARQFQRYAAGVAGSYRAGRNNTVLYHPNAACGSSQVYIQNKATAGLYSYTPYQPNAAALAAGYGEGNTCSSYGNRNFFSYFTDWFGSTQSTGGGEILAKYQAMGGAGSALGGVAGTFHCGLRDGGCFQAYQNGSMYWSRASGAQPVVGALMIAYAERKWETGGLGYPTGDGYCGLVGGGCFQPFQGGTLYWTGSGHAVTRGPIHDAWGARGWEAGWLGYPAGDQICGLAGGGCGQGFRNGTMYWSPATGAYPSAGRMLAKWDSLGRESGALGYPTWDELCGLAQGGCQQNYRNGSLYWSPGSGTHSIGGSIFVTWQASGWEGSWLGYPNSVEICGLRGGGCFQVFQNGSIYWSPTTGAHAVPMDMRNKWSTIGWETGILGYPTWGALCGLAQGGCQQNFQYGSLYSSPATGTHFIRGSVFATWQASGWEGGWLGYPTTDEVCGLRDGGCYQMFQNGSIYFSPRTGAHPVPLDIRHAWAAAGWELGGWGYPVGPPTGSAQGLDQRFQGGTARWNQSTGQVTFG